MQHKHRDQEEEKEKGRACLRVSRSLAIYVIKFTLELLLLRNLLAFIHVCELNREKGREGEGEIN